MAENWSKIWGISVRRWNESDVTTKHSIVRHFWSVLLQHDISHVKTVIWETTSIPLVFIVKSANDQLPIRDGQA